MSDHPTLTPLPYRPPMPAHDYARQYASDTLSGRAEGGQFEWGERNLAKAYRDLDVQLKHALIVIEASRKALESTMSYAAARPKYPTAGWWGIGSKALKFIADFKLNPSLPPSHSVVVDGRIVSVPFGDPDAE